MEKRQRELIDAQDTIKRLEDQLRETQEAKDELDDEELYLLLRKSFLLFEHWSELTSTNERHHEVEPVLRLKEEFQLGQELMVGILEDLKLRESLLDCELLDDSVLSHTLDGVHLWASS